MKNITFLRGYSIAIFVLCLEVSCILLENSGQLVLINNSNELIRLVHIEICNQVIDIKNVKPYEKHRCLFNVKNDSHYDVTVCFASGKKLNKQLGYVTHGFNFEHTLVITEANISITDAQIE